MAARFTVKFSAKARSDIRAILEYIALDSPTSAIQFVDWLEEEVMSLDRFPFRCPIAKESKEWGHDLRVMVVGSYRVLYTIRGVTVVVIRVRHGARRPPTSLDD